MNAPGNVNVSVAADDITIGELLEALDRHPSSPLTFRCEGRRLRKGYHVTEVKAGTFAGLDCGANPEAWTEIFVQLWDVDDAPEQMTARKFAAIIGKVADHLSLDRSARLTFEVSDGIQPMQLHRAAAPTIGGDEIVVELSPRPASCKPRDRWLAEQQAAGSCCGPAGSPCCP